MTLLKRMLPVRIKDRAKRVLKRALFGTERIYASTSKCGEDRILWYLLRQRQAGFFVDVGAYHPITASNTFVFYQQGWRGINIDPAPGCMAAFRELRPEDVNLEFAIGLSESEQPYYMLGGGHEEMNTLEIGFQQNLYDEIAVDSSSLTSVLVKVYPLSRVLADYRQPSECIDFMTIDVEGREKDVLQSNNWDRYRPIIVMIEDHAPMQDGACTSPVAGLMREARYSCVYKTPNETIFLNRDYRISKSGMVVL
jgi:FkbM family methyltransferase